MRKTIIPPAVFLAIILLPLIPACFKDDEFAKKEVIQSYLSDNGLEDEPLASGLYVFNTTPAETDTGTLAPEYGDSLRLAFTGYTADDETVFVQYTTDKPYSFVYKKKQSIAAWDEGIRYLKENKSIKLVAPPELAYGDTQIGQIPPNSVVIFDINCLAITPDTLR